MKMSRYIHCDIWTEILARLPAADAIRCTSVCKSWFQLMASPFFINMHLRLSISNTESSRVIVRYDSKVYVEDSYYLHRDNQTFDEIRELDPPGRGDANILVHGSSNGVFCYSRDYILPIIYGETFILWNPSIHRYSILPKSRDRDAAGNLLQQNTYSSHRIVGFGFLPNTNDYKIVRVIYSEWSDDKYLVPPQVEIYDSSKRSWRDEDATKLSYVLNPDCDQALLNGRMYWAACNPHCVGGRFVGLIVSFDLTTEKFDTLMLPEFAQNKEPDYSGVSTLKESLCLLLNIGDGISIFVMKKYHNTNYWEEYFHYNEVRFRFLYFRENGEILGADWRHENKWELVSCDLNTNTDEAMNLGVHEDALYFSGVYACVDSLFLLF